MTHIHRHRSLCDEQGQHSSECLHHTVDILSEHSPHYDGIHRQYSDRRKSRKVAGRVDA